MVYALSIEEELLRKQYIEFISRWQTRRQREIIIKTPRMSIRYRPATLMLTSICSTAKMGRLTCKPVCSVNTGPRTTLPKSQEFIMTHQQKCPRWEKFIDEVMSGDREKAEFFQKASAMP